MRENDTLNMTDTAVIVAEDITSRFLNVISLFNGMIPLIAIQMNALKNSNQVGLMFTTVVDQMSFGLVDEDEEAKEVTDKAYWIHRGSKRTVEMADKLAEIAKKFDPLLEQKYNKFYIGLAKLWTTYQFRNISTSKGCHSFRTAC